MFAFALELAKKDLRIYFRDPVAWLLGFLLPIVLVTIFGFLMGAVWGGSGPTPKVTMYVVDEDNSLRSRQFINDLRGADMLRVRPRQEASAITRSEAEQAVKDGQVSHALIIESGFSEVPTGAAEGGQFRLLRDPGRTMEDKIVRLSLLQAVFSSADRGWWIGAVSKLFGEAGIPEDQIATFQSRANAMTEVINGFSPSSEDTADPPTADKAQLANPATSPMDSMLDLLPLETEDFSPPERPRQASFQIAQAVAGMSVMMLMFGVTSCGRTLLQERERGTMSRLLSIGVPRSSLLAGTAIFTIIVGLMQMIVMLIYGEFMFHVGIFNDPLTLVVLTLLWVITASSFGMLIATGAKTEKQADMLATILIISMAALGGCWFPLQMLDLPTPLELTTRSTATFWAMTGFQSMLWNGADLFNSRMITAIAVQTGYTLLMSTAAIWLFRRNYLRG
ncbi:ABC transporter permease [Planctomycetaceae bacterium SH139]